MKKFIKAIMAMSLAMTMVVAGVLTADAATVYRDDWYLNKITPTTGTTSDTVAIVKNPSKKYIGVCSNSTVTDDVVTIGNTSVTTITSSVNVYRQAGDVQTIVATTISSSPKTKFKMTLTCDSNDAVNEGYVYWLVSN